MEVVYTLTHFEGSDKHVTAFKKFRNEFSLSRELNDNSSKLEYQFWDVVFQCPCWNKNIRRSFPCLFQTRSGYNPAPPISGLTPIRSSLLLALTASSITQNDLNPVSTRRTVGYPLASALL